MHGAHFQTERGGDQTLQHSSQTKLLQDLPILVLSHIMSFLPHSCLRNLSFGNKKLRRLVMREWDNNPNLWHQITVSPTLSHSGFLSLKNELCGRQMKIRHVNIIKIHESDLFLSARMCKFITTLHKISRIIIQSNVTNQQIIPILSGFSNQAVCELCKINGFSLDYIEFTKLKFVANKIGKSNPPLSSIYEQWQPI